MGLIFRVFARSDVDIRVSSSERRQSSLLSMKDKFALTDSKTQREAHNWGLFEPFTV